MWNLCTAVLLTLMSLGAAQHAATTQGTLNYHRTRDVIYGRSYGTSLTMDVIRPRKNANGLGVIWIVSGGWYSSPESINSQSIELFVGELLKRGYTVFAVCHGSAPRFTIPEAIADVNRAVRFVRHHAEDYGVDPERLGVTGGSAGGHLSLMIGCGNAPANGKSPDPVERTPSRVSAVACFFPPTDFLNYGEAGKVVDFEKGVLAPFVASFEFKRFDEKRRRFVPVTEEKEILATYRQISPIEHVDAKDPPVLMIHGDKDTLVPYQQATTMLEKLKAAGVEAEVITRAGQGHGWANLGPDVAAIADWFDEHLKAKPATGRATTPSARQSATSPATKAMTRPAAR